MKKQKKLKMLKQELNNHLELTKKSFTSGRSKNVIEAAKTAKESKMIVISITGKSPNPLEKLVDFKISVPSSQTEKVQQVHLIIYHLLCSLIETEF